MTSHGPADWKSKSASTLRAMFPNLSPETVRVIGGATHRYNCIAYAAGDENRWWSPSTAAYWPPWAPYGKSLQNLVALFAGLGYVPDADCGPEPGWQKVALYSDGKIATHVALQAANGRWRSKIGEYVLIEHPDPQSLQGDTYGEVKAVMRRPAARITQENPVKCRPPTA